MHALAGVGLMATMYEAASANFREVEKALTALERTINRSIRDNDDAAVAALTRAQLLLVSIKAEARLIKIAYMPDGLPDHERSKVLGADTAVDRWLDAIEFAFRRHYRVSRRRHDPEDFLEHDELARYRTLRELVSKDLGSVISLRNKLAHGQWVYPFNSELTAVEAGTVRLLSAENTFTLKIRDNLIQIIGNAVIDLVKSAAGFEALFNAHFRRIRENRRHLATVSYDDWCARVRSTKRLLRPSEGSDGVEGKG